jgi:hypothetical protein
MVVGRREGNGEGRSEFIRGVEIVRKLILDHHWHIPFPRGICGLVSWYYHGVHGAIYYLYAAACIAVAQVYIMYLFGGTYVGLRKYPTSTETE